MVSRGGRARRSRLSLALLAPLLAVHALVRVGSAQGLPSEYEVKAALLYNFAKFVDWPPVTQAAEPSGFVISILGNDPFGDSIDRLLLGKSVNGRQVVVRRLRELDELGSSQIVFVSDSERDKLPQILERLDASPTLTVGEMEHFAEDGGVIRFHIQDRRIRLEINVAAAQKARLKLSSELLKLARIVG